MWIMGNTRSFFKTSIARLTAPLWIIAINLFLVFNCHSDSPTNASPAGILEFFKASINSRPDVESFVVSQRDFKNDITLFFAGAKSGTNFVLRMITDTNYLFDSSHQFISGRSGSNAYELNRNAVSFGFGSNALTGGVEMDLDLTRQLLGMGVGDLKPESIQWKDNTFTAKSIFNDFSSGNLELSNGLPSKLSISGIKQLYKVVQYTYPNPPLSLAGFPEKLSVFGVKGGHLNERLEIIFYSVKLATNESSEDFFSASHFIGSNILHTNIYRDSDLFVQNRLGAMVRAPDSLRKSGGLTNLHSRVLIFIGLAVITAIPLLFLFAHKQHQRK